VPWDTIVTLRPTPDSIVKRDRFWPPRDRHDRVIPHHGEGTGWLRACPGLVGFFDRRVPPEFWAEGVDGTGQIITIACRCGEEPVLRFQLRGYSIAECPCGRFFMHDGMDIRVGHDPEKLPRPDPEPADPEPPVERRRREAAESDIAWQP
jgi:hypothetical protein